MRLPPAASAFAVLLGGLGSSACDLGPTSTVAGSGHVVTESRNVAGFTSVDLTGTGVLVVTQGDSDGL